MAYNTALMAKNLERTHYTLSYEEGQLVRRGKKQIGGHEVILYNNYSKFPNDIRGEVVVRLLVEVANATGSDPESVRKKLLANYMAASDTIFGNARRGVYDPVPVEVISYTVDPRRRNIQMKMAPIASSLN